MAADEPDPQREAVPLPPRAGPRGIERIYGSAQAEPGPPRNRDRVPPGAGELAGSDQAWSVVGVGRYIEHLLCEAPPKATHIRAAVLAKAGHIRDQAQAAARPAWRQLEADVHRRCAAREQAEDEREAALQRHKQGATAVIATAHRRPAEIHRAAQHDADLRTTHGVADSERADDRR